VLVHGLLSSCHRVIVLLPGRSVRRVERHLIVDALLGLVKTVDRRGRGV
jgi:hypothetical protein